MKLASIVGTFLLAVSTIAAPRSQLADRIARREAQSNGQFSHRWARPPTPAGPGSKEKTVTSDGTHVTYTDNWAGAVIENPPKGQTWSKVSAQITVPHVTTPKPSSSSSSPKPASTYAASAWVGIDGDSCITAILQGGIDSYAFANGSTTYSAWYEWFPDASYDFSGIGFSAGDAVQMSVLATSLSTGSVTIENLSTHKNVTQQITGLAPLCGSNADWIVEDFVSDGAAVPFANFGSITFSDAVAGTGKASQNPAAGATIYDLKENDDVLTKTTVERGQTVTVKYV